MRNIFDKMLIPSLLITGMAFNLLLPVHSSGYYFSILAGEAIYEHCFRAFFEGELVTNSFSVLGSRQWFSSAPLYDVMIYVLETMFGNWGVAVLQISVWFLVGLFSFLCIRLISLLSSTGNSENIRLPFLAFIALLFTGSVLYGNDISSVHLVYLEVLVVMSLYLMGVESHKRYFQFLAIAIYLLALFFDYRMLLIPALLWFVLFRSIYSKSIFNGRSHSEIYFIFIFQLAGIFLTLSVPGLRESAKAGFYSLTRQYQLLDVLYPQLKSFPLLFNYYSPSFEAGFLLFMLTLFILRNAHNTRSMLVIVPLNAVLFYLSLVFPFFRFVYSLFLVSSLSINPGENLPEKIAQQAYLRIENMFLVLSNGFSRLSYSGRVFVLIAFSFVQLTSFLRLPVTDIGMPKKLVTRAIENNKCIGIRPLSEAGYIAYRFSYAKSSCRPPILWQTLSSLSDEEVLKAQQSIVIDHGLIQQ